MELNSEEKTLDDVGCHYGYVYYIGILIGRYTAKTRTASSKPFLCRITGWFLRGASGYTS